MKKGLITSFILALALLLPGASFAQAPLQAKPLFPFFSQEKTAPATPATTSTTQAEITEDTIDMATLKDQPLPVRRKVVASELDGIALRLSTLADKTKTAALLLAKNNIDTTASQTELAKATLSLAQARLTIDSLVAAANDPLNETVVSLSIGTESFKEVVIKAEEELRTSRASIITALGLLKAAVAPESPIN
jgi:hypothetical protein